MTHWLVGASICAKQPSLVMEKEPGMLPVSVDCGSVGEAAPPVFVTVNIVELPAMASGVSSNWKVVGEIEKVAPADIIPVPVSAAVASPPGVAERCSVALRAPAAVGVKVTLIVHMPLAATGLLHVVVLLKSPALAPSMLTLGAPVCCVPRLVAVNVNGVPDCERVTTPKSLLGKSKAKPPPVGVNKMCAFLWMPLGTMTPLPSPVASTVPSVASACRCTCTVPVAPSGSWSAKVGLGGIDTAGVCGKSRVAAAPPLRVALPCSRAMLLMAPEASTVKTMPVTLLPPQLPLSSATRARSGVLIFIVRILRRAGPSRRWCRAACSTSHR